MKIRWEEPPAPRRGRPADLRTADEKFADELRKHPDQWARFRDDVNSSIAYQIKVGQAAAFRPAGAFDAVCRNVDSGKSRGRIYVRYIGEGDPE